MADRLLNLPALWLTLVMFAVTFVATAGVYLAVIKLSQHPDRAVAFKALSPGMLPPLGIIFGLLVGFIAAQVWSDFERAKVAVATEATALRGVMLLTESLPPEQQARFRGFINRHIETAANEEWPKMALGKASLTTLPSSLRDALKSALLLAPADEAQKTARGEIIKDLEDALDARRQRLIIGQSAVSPIKWIALVLQGLCALVAIAMVHSGNRLTCAIALTMFATGIALSLVLIAAYSHPFHSVGPGLLRQVIGTEAAGASDH